MTIKLCDIQGRLFELSGAKEYDSATFIKAFMTSETAKGLDSKYNRLQWAGEEYLLAEVIDSAKLTPGGKVYDKETLFWSGYLYRFWYFAIGEDTCTMHQIREVVLDEIVLEELRRTTYYARLTPQSSWSLSIRKALLKIARN